MDPFHLIISAIPPSTPVSVLLPPQIWTNLESAFISWLGSVVIADMCGKRWLIDSSDSATRNPNSPVSTSDVTMLTPGAEATECIFFFVNDIKPNSTRSCVLNWNRSDFNDPIAPAPFIEDFGSSRYENNGPSKVQIFLNEAKGPGGKLRHPS